MISPKRDRCFNPLAILNYNHRENVGARTAQNISVLSTDNAARTDESDVTSTYTNPLVQQRG